MFDTHVPAHKVLIVDDESVPRSLESFALEGTGRYFTMQASNASDALAMLSADRYDAAIVDIDMPDMTGTELITRIRAKLGHDMLPIVLVLPEGSHYTAEDFEMTAATAAIAKPFDPWDLARLLDTLTPPLDGMEHVLTVEAVLHGFPFPTMILDSEHHVLIANASFYAETRTGVGRCYIYCAEEMHEDGAIPGECPLEECKRTGNPAEHEVDTVFGRLRTSVYPLAIKTAGGDPLFLHVTQPVHD